MTTTTEPPALPLLDLLLDRLRLLLVRLLDRLLVGDGPFVHVGLLHVVVHFLAPQTPA